MRTSRQRTGMWAAALACALAIAGAAAVAQQGGDPIDWEQARAIRHKQREGKPLTPEERAYLDKAGAARRAEQGTRDKDRPISEGKPSIGLTPLTDVKPDQTYQDQDGGLYGQGRNTPPEAHLQAALAEAKRIQPLDAQGRPDPAGKIVLISIGMSNTTQEFSTFVSLTDGDPAKSPYVVIVDGAQGCKDAERWSKPGQRGDKVDPWGVLDERLNRAGVSPRQVQVAWIKQARAVPRQHGEFPAHARELQEHLRAIVQMLKQRYPNVRLAYLSSRIYAGYATSQLNPEPYAYESAFSVRWLIQDQLAGKPKLNHDPASGEVKAPLLLWGPYLWADGVEGRAAGDLVYLREDLGRDGAHPSPSGRQKVADLLLTFFKTDPTARPWFTAK